MPIFPTFKDLRPSGHKHTKQREENNNKNSTIFSVNSEAISAIDSKILSPIKHTGSVFFIKVNCLSFRHLVTIMFLFDLSYEQAIAYKDKLTHI